MSYVYIQSEPTLWTVGHYDPAGKWHPVSDHDSPGEAGERVCILNGGTSVVDADTIRHAKAWRDLCRRVGKDEDTPVAEVLNRSRKPAGTKVSPQRPASVEQEPWFMAGLLAAQAFDAVEVADGCAEIDATINHLIDALKLVIEAVDNLAGVAAPDGED